MFTCKNCNGWFTDRQTYDAHPCADVASESGSQSPNSSFQSSQLSDTNKGTTLIDEFSKYKEKQESGRMTKKEMWDFISKTLNSKGYSYNRQQVSGRWKSLMRGYKNNKDHNAKSGNNPKSYEYETALDELFASDPCVLSIITKSSTKRKTSCETDLDSTDTERIDESDTTDDHGHDSTPPDSTKKLRVSRSSSKEVVEMFKTYVDEQKAKQTEDLERCERMHKEKLCVMKRLINAIQSGSAGNHPKSNRSHDAQ